MKVTVEPEGQNEEKVVHVEEQGGGMPGVDGASLWTMLAIICFGAFLLMFVFFNRFTSSDEVIISDPVEDSVEMEDPIDEMEDVPDAVDLDGSASPGVVEDTPAL